MNNPAHPYDATAASGYLGAFLLYNKLFPTLSAEQVRAAGEVLSQLSAREQVQQSHDRTALGFDAACEAP